MGLDMYLSAKKHFYNARDDALAKDISEKLGVSKPVQSVSFMAMYWRKCHIINEYFINLLTDRDILQECEVDREEIEKLLEYCTDALAHRAEGEIPRSNYFRDSEPDEDFYEEMEITKEGLEKCLAEFSKEFYFTYCASW